MNDDLGPVFVGGVLNTTGTGKWISLDGIEHEQWGYVPKRTTAPWKVSPQPYQPYQPPPPMQTIPNVHDALLEMLQKELEKSRRRIKKQVEQDGMTAEQAVEAMHRAFIEGIKWALDNLPEIADELGYALPATKDATLQAIMSAMGKVSYTSTGLTFTVASVGSTISSGSAITTISQANTTIAQTE